MNTQQALNRWGLRLQDGSRACMPHMTMDCIEVVIKTQDEPFAGTDNKIHFQVGPGWRWLLNEGILDLEFTNLARKSIADVVLIVLALVTLAAVLRWMVRDRFIDFPCEAGGSYKTSTFPPEQRRILLRHQDHNLL